MTAPRTEDHLLTRQQAEALVRIRDKGPAAWCNGRRAGGAVARMFGRMASLGLCTRAPYRITAPGPSGLGYVLQEVGTRMATSGGSEQRTYAGVAEAMADQWGTWLVEVAA